MKLSVILLQYGGSAMTLSAIETFRTHCHLEHELLLVDNGSRNHADRDAASRIGNLRFLALEENVGFGAANNRAAAEASGEILLFLNNDTVTEDDFVSAVLGEFDDPSVGIVGPCIVSGDGSPQLSCGPLPSITQEAIDRFFYRQVDRGTVAGKRYAERRSARRAPVGWVSGAAIFVRADLFRALHGFDESIFLYFEDKDLCARAWRAGSQVIFQPAGSVVHLRGGSSETKSREEIRAIYRASQRIYYAKHRSRLEQWLLRLYQGISR